MEQYPKIQKIFSGIRYLIKLYWFTPQVLCHVSVDLVITKLKLRIINTLLRSTMLDSRLNA